MHQGRIEGATRTLGVPKDWDKEKQGPCVGLAIEDVELEGGTPAMASVWFPTPEELARLVAGAPVKLWVAGRMHPPVMLTVGDAPDTR